MRYAPLVVLAALGIVGCSAPVTKTENDKDDTRVEAKPAQKDGKDANDNKKVEKAKDKAKDDGKPLIEYQYNAKGWVGFSVMHDNKHKLITYAEVNPESKELQILNALVVRIDSKDYVFGVSKEGKWIKQKADLGKGPDGKPRPGHLHAWAVGDVVVTQIVEIVPSKTGKLDACLVKFQFENKGQVEHKIGLRQLIDTFMVEADNHAFALPGQKRIIQDQADFKGEAVPDIILAFQNADVKNPGLTAVYTLNPGKGMLPPDRVALTHSAANETEAFSWEVPIRDINEDAALIFWWNPRALLPGEDVAIAFGVGLGAIDLDAPAKK